MNCAQITERSNRILGRNTKRDESKQVENLMTGEEQAEKTLLINNNLDNELSHNNMNSNNDPPLS